MWQLSRIRNIKKQIFWYGVWHLVVNLCINANLCFFSLYQGEEALWWTKLASYFLPLRRHLRQPLQKPKTISSLRLSTSLITSQAKTTITNLVEITRKCYHAHSVVNVLIDLHYLIGKSNFFLKISLIDGNSTWFCLMTADFQTIWIRMPWTKDNSM